MKDKKIKYELPSGIIKAPLILMAGEDLQVNDVVWHNRDAVFALRQKHKNNRPIFGVVAANSVKGKPVLVASVR
jgi:hypothetical protein